MMQMRRTQIGGISVAKKYLLSVLLLAVLFLPHFNVEYLQRFSFSRVLTAMRYLSLFVMLLGIISWVLMYRGRLNYSIFVLLTFYTATIALSTVINRGDLFEALQSYLIRYLPLLFLSLLLQLYPYYAVQALYIILEILCLANLVSMVLYPEGLYLSELTNNRCFLLGHKNSVGYFTVALLALSIYKNHLKNRKLSWHNYFDLGIVLLTAALAQSATGLVVAVVCLLGFISLIWDFRFLRINAIIPVCVIWALTVGVVFFEIQTRFVSVIATLLNRDVSFSSRTLIWGQAIANIARNPWIGCGFLSTEAVTDRLILGSTHCTILSCLFFGGIFALIAYGLYVIVIAKHVTRNRDAKEGGFFLCVVCSILVASMMEALETNFVAMLTLLLCCQFKTILRNRRVIN